MINELVGPEELAARWGVARSTALAYTRQTGFPPSVSLSARTLRWELDDVVAWERTRKVAAVRRVTRRMRARTAQITKPIVRAKRKAA